MSKDEVISGEVVKNPPDELPANEMHGPAGLASRMDDTSWLFTGSEGAELADDDPFASIIRQILSSASADVVLTPVEATQASDIIDIPIVVFDFALNKSEYDVGSPFYASIQAQYAKTEEPIVVNCGHKTVIAQLIRLKQLGAMPFAATFETRGHSRQGTPMLRLRKYEEPETEAPPF